VLRSSTWSARQAARPVGTGPGSAASAVARFLLPAAVLFTVLGSVVGLAAEEVGDGRAAALQEFKSKVVDVHGHLVSGSGGLKWKSAIVDSC
jgi:hypothetical protein